MEAALGFDPDTKTTGWAVVSLDEIHECGIVYARKDRPKPHGMVEALEVSGVLAPDYQSMGAWDVVVIEGQHMMNKAVSFESLRMLAHISGTIHSLCKKTQWVKILVPPPAGPGAWKTSIKKEIHQARVLKKYGYRSPEDFAEAFDLDPKLATHVIDAVGLARFGLTRNPNA